MTAKRDSKSRPKKERPKIKKETLRDLDTEKKGAGVKGGRVTSYDSNCPNACSL